MGTSVVGIGKPGVPAGDVLSVQGVVGGTPVPTTDTSSVPPSTSTTANIAQSAVVVTIQAANVNRKGLIIHNNGTARLFIKYGAGASLVDFTDAIGISGTHQLEWPVSTQIITGIWEAAGGGNAKVTELLP
jgi:hypothetical protein